jgi:hypothetical protein
MTQDEIIEMAVKAGMHIDVLTLGRNVDLLEAFAKLVAQYVKAEEREACAKVCEEGEFMTFGCAAEAIRARGDNK